MLFPDRETKALHIKWNYC